MKGSIRMNATIAMDSAGARPDLDKGLGAIGTIGFGAAILAALVYVAYSIYADASSAGVQATTYLPFILLFIALLIALGFEFVNGFHDTANAVATVIYTNAMPANVAVVWSGFFNFLGVLLSTGAVAFGIVSLLPVELILQVGSSAGFAMVFALLLAAILWNLATWWLGIPSSSSHTLIGSIIGVGVANAMIHGKSGTSGVDWSKATEIGQSLLYSPLIGFGVAALLFLAMKVLIRNKALYQEPKDGVPPPMWIRALLIFTCTGVSFAHGSNDGQKGMGLIMLILIGAAPTAYALNRTMAESATPHFVQISEQARTVFRNRADQSPLPSAAEARTQITAALGKTDLDRPETYAALAALADDVATKVKEYGAIRHVPAAATPNLRNDMFLASDAIHSLKKRENLFVGEEAEVLKAYETSLNDGTRYIPIWVKVSVALALGLGTMVGWKRIVVTVGSRIGKKHLTYAQGASAEITAAGTIGLAEAYGLPVSTTHILSSGVAGTMAANGSGLQWATVRNLAAAWLLTLPAAITLAGLLYAGLRFVF